MGQTPSKDAQYAELYSSYIQQQQNLIYQQQQQINSLFNSNLQNQMLQQQMPPNMLFQYDMNQFQGQQAPQWQGQQQQPNQWQTQSHSQRSYTQLQVPSAKTKRDTYKILGLSKEYDEKMLKKAYLKAAMKSHPDRGCSPQAFQ